jgi:tetratricopeptide (TPR) repeat protein
VALTVLAFAQLTELRGELGFMRFCHLRQTAAKSRNPDEFAKAVPAASAEGELVMLFSKGNPDALLEISTSSLRWSGAEGLDPLLRLRLGEKAVRAAALAVRAAPSDYEPWLWLARTQAALGLWEQAQLCLERAQELAPPGEELQLLSARPEQVGGPSKLSAAGRGEGRKPSG